MNLLEDGLVYINVMKLSNLYVTGCDQNSWKSRPNVLHTQKAEPICFFDRNSCQNSWSFFRRISMQISFPSGLENEKDHQYSTFLFIHWQKTVDIRIPMEFRPKSRWIRLMIFVKKCKIKLLIKLTCIKSVKLKLFI